LDSILSEGLKVSKTTLGLVDTTPEPSVALEYALSPGFSDQIDPEDSLLSIILKIDENAVKGPNYYRNDWRARIYDDVPASAIKAVYLFDQKKFMSSNPLRELIIK